MGRSGRARGSTGAREVDEYIAGAPEAARPSLETLRRTIRAAAPEATETISYRIPALKLHGRSLVWYAGFKNHCSLYPASARVLEAHGEEVQPYLSGKGTFRFPLDRPIPAALVKRIVKTRVQEVGSAEGGYRRGGRGA